MDHREAANNVKFAVEVISEEVDKIEHLTRDSDRWQSVEHSVRTIRGKLNFLYQTEKAEERTLETVYQQVKYLAAAQRDVQTNAQALHPLIIQLRDVLSHWREVDEYGAMFGAASRDTGTLSTTIQGGVDSLRSWLERVNTYQEHLHQMITSTWSLINQLEKNEGEAQKRLEGLKRTVEEIRVMSR